MESRRIRQVIHPCNVYEGTGIPIRRSFPSYLLDYPDPFLLLDHFAWDNPADYRSGFPKHPHRGIETVTGSRFTVDGSRLQVSGSSLNRSTENCRAAALGTAALQHLEPQHPAQFE